MPSEKTPSPGFITPVPIPPHPGMATTFEEAERAQFLNAFAEAVKEREAALEAMQEWAHPFQMENIPDLEGRVWRVPVIPVGERSVTTGIFKTLQTSGSDDIVAEGIDDVLVLAVGAQSGNDLTIVFDAATKTATWVPPITPTYDEVTTTGGGATAVYDGGGVTFDDDGANATFVVENVGTQEVDVTVTGTLDASTGLTIGGDTVMTPTYSGEITGTPEYMFGFTMDEGGSIVWEADSILSLWPMWTQFPYGFVADSSYAETYDFSSGGGGSVTLTQNSIPVLDEQTAPAAGDVSGDFATGLEVVAADETTAGKIERATVAEGMAGTDSERAITAEILAKAGAFTSWFYNNW